MSVAIYAAVIERTEDGDCVGPALSFKHHGETLLASDAYERNLRDEDPFIANPDFIEHAEMKMSNAAAYTLFTHLGFFPEDDCGPMSFPLEAVQKATFRALNGPKATFSKAVSVTKEEGGPTMVSCGTPEGVMQEMLNALLALCVLGRTHNATLVAAC
jgi:hypothetical protein